MTIRTIEMGIISINLLGGFNLSNSDRQVYMIWPSMSSAAIQLSNEDNHPSRGDTIKYIYTDSQHKNPLCRVVPIVNKHQSNTEEVFSYDKEKYREMILDAAETVFRIFWL